MVYIILYYIISIFFVFWAQEWGDVQELTKTKQCLPPRSYILVVEANKSDK